jgi:hypothetical protein
MAATICISEVPGFEKQTSTPPLIKVSNILSAPFIFDHSYDYSGIVLLFCCSVVLLFCCSVLMPDPVKGLGLSQSLSRNF